MFDQITINEMETTRKCTRCGRELTFDKYRMTRWGDYTSVCNDCTAQLRREKAQEKKARIEAEERKQEMEASAKRLKDFTPRELMQELADRGYKGKLTYTKTIEIDIEHF